MGSSEQNLQFSCLISENPDVFDNTVAKQLKGSITWNMLAAYTIRRLIIPKPSRARTMYEL
ncbi:hypothetical protein V1478_003438 [Vespula squamosa]|uniref:Uncharacterized protein n=1 Tax=Vespula squamosa TaxID=30214 RepID=A0ABD2BM67_VESSQ